MGNFDSDEGQTFFYSNVYTPFTSFYSISFLLKDIKV